MIEDGVSWTAFVAVCTALGMACTGVWCVASLVSAGKEFRESMTQNVTALRVTIDKLSGSVQKMDDRLDEHNLRIDRLENGRQRKP